MLRFLLPSGFARLRPSSLLVTVALAGCAAGGRPETAPVAAPGLPAVPAVAGPLTLRVQYPSPNALIGARDSTFLLGSVGHGAASLTVNGAPVRVLPNGAFLAWVAMPPRSAPRFELSAALAGQPAQRLTLPIRLPEPRPALSADQRPWHDTASVVPRAPLALGDEEMVRVAVRVAPGARAEVRPGAAGCSDGLVVPLPLLPSPGSDIVAREISARRLRCGAELAVFGRGDTLPATRALGAVTRGDSLGLYRIGTAVADTDAAIIARPIPGGTYKWFLMPGTVLRATGREGASLRFRLDEGVEAWIDASEATPLPPGTVAPRRVIANARVVPSAGYVDLVLPMSARPAYRVESVGNTLSLTLHGVAANTDIIWFQRGDSLVRDVQWRTDATDRAVYTVQLQQAVFGWLAFWRGDAFVLRLRRPPVVEVKSPLRGLRIAVDPGHPPAGSTGPTGLYEGVVTLAVGERVVRLLTERGAVPVMTRTSAEAVPLGDRQIIARRADAQAFVSIHLNAKPDGVNPNLNNGSGTYYFQPHSAALARAVQSRIVAHLGLPDEGTWFDNLAVVRPAWMPSVLVEGAYVIVPEQEAALRTPAFQEAYALGIVEGLEAYFRSLATPGGAR